MLSHYLIFVLGACLSHVEALPKVSFPLAEQVPPAPIAGQNFVFTFSAQTFESVRSLEYSLIASPGWLQLDSSTRTLQGTPSAADVGTTIVQIQATDAEGSASTELSLSVLATNSVKVRQSIVQESLSRAGSVSAPFTLSLQPQADFNIAFGSSVFEMETGDVFYFATSDGHTPLPAWVSFDTAAVSFGGRTPTLLTPQSSPQTFGFSLAAGQGRGVSQAAFNFAISVTNHLFQFLNATQSFELVPGKRLEIPSLLQSLRRDGASVAVASIVRQSSNQPDWLMLSSGDLSFSGVVPPSPQSTQFQLSVTDDQNNVAVIEINLKYDNQSIESRRETYLQAVDAIRTQEFSYKFNITAISDLSDSIDVDLSTAKSWLTWVPRNMTVIGTVPNDKQTISFNISLSIIKDAEVREILYLPINVVDASSSTNPDDASSTQSSNENSNSSATDGNPAGKAESGLNHKELALKIALPLITIAVLLAIILLMLRCMRRRRSRKATIETTESASDSGPSQVSMRPSSSSNVVIIGHSSNTESLRSFLASSPPPRIDMTWSTYQRPLSRFFSQSSRDDRSTPTTRSSWSDMLNEVDSTIHYGHYDRIDDHDRRPSNISLPPAPTKVNYLTRQSAVTSSVRGTDLQRHPPSLRASRFNGRRRSGLGHGMIPAESGTAANQGTLRQVPLSPLVESPVPSQSVNGSTKRHQLVRNVSSSKILSTMYSNLERLRSSASGSSRYDDPDVESSQGSYVRSENSTKARWDDRDWLTMSNDSRSQKSTGKADRHEASRNSNILPPSFSNGMTVPREQSQSNSLRFI